MAAQSTVTTTNIVRRLKRNQRRLGAGLICIVSTAPEPPKQRLPRLPRLATAAFQRRPDKSCLRRSFLDCSSGRVGPHGSQSATTGGFFVVASVTRPGMDCAKAIL